MTIKIRHYEGLGYRVEKGITLFDNFIPVLTLSRYQSFENHFALLLNRRDFFSSFETAKKATTRYLCRRNKRVTESYTVRRDSQV